MSLTILNNNFEFCSAVSTNVLFTNAEMATEWFLNWCAPTYIRNFEIAQMQLIPKLKPVICPFLHTLTHNPIVHRYSVRWFAIWVRFFCLFSFLFGRLMFTSHPYAQTCEMFDLWYLYFVFCIYHSMNWLNGSRQILHLRCGAMSHFNECALSQLLDSFFPGVWMAI